MSFTIEPGTPVLKEFRRVAAEEFETTIGRLKAAEGATLAVAVHESRKSCKRLRALFRLVRPSLPDRRYRTLNASVRDAARELSAARDAAALVGMFDDLLAAHGADPKDDVMKAVRARLEEQVDAMEWTETSGPPRAMVRARERLELARDMAATVKLADEDWDALGPGLQSIYSRGRKAMDELRREGTAEHAHEWRKMVKYTWHHLQLLEGTAPSMLAPAAQRFHQLADALGDAHNLAVLRDTLDGAPSRFGGRSAIAPVMAMADESRAELEDRALRLGLRLYAEPPGVFSQRLGAYWRTAGTVGAELAAGELAAISIRSIPRPS